MPVSQRWPPSEFSRGISFSRSGPSVSLAGTSTGELWFSFTANKLRNDNAAAEGGLVIGSATVGNPRIPANDGSDGLIGFGIAPTTAGDNWTAYAWDGSSRTAEGASFGVATDGTETNLLIGQISYNTGSGGADVFPLHSYVLNGGSISGGSLNIIMSVEVAADETQLNTLNLTRQVNTHYDEIRIGESLADVTGVVIPEPSLTALASLGLLGLLRRSRR